MLTDKGIEKAIKTAKASGVDTWLTEPGARGEGRLCLRAGKRGASFYYRYAGADGKQARLPLGSYGTLGLKEARAKAGELSKLHQSGVRDLHGWMAHEQAEQQAAIEAAAQARAEAERQTKSGSLKALCNGYVAHLERLGKSSADEARRLFKKNVFDAFPDLAAGRAKSISHRDVNTILATLIDAGKGRTAGKLRSYLRAAFAGALAAEFDPTVHPDLHGFSLESNPVAAVPAKMLARYNRACERALSEAELRAFLRRLDNRLFSDALRLTLFLGGQRIAQLTRLRPSDVDRDANTVTLLDPKGARQVARVHVLPLTAPALAIIDRLLAINGDKAFLISSRGKVPLTGGALSRFVAGISVAMVDAKESREPFQLRDIRRTCETMLARMGISSDLRGQLLSHGLGGVQQRHYDKHSYADEKRAALEAWAAKLDEITTGTARENVVPLHAGA